MQKTVHWLMPEEAKTIWCARKNAPKLPLDVGECQTLGKESASDKMSRRCCCEAYSPCKLLESNGCALAIRLIGNRLLGVVVEVALLLREVWQQWG